MNLLHHLRHVVPDVLQTIVPDGVLHQTIDIDGHDALAARGDAASA